MLGRRREDVSYCMMPSPWPEPGDYWRYVDEEGRPKVARGSMEESVKTGNLTGGMWGACTPNGLLCNLFRHTVREHDDGTISVRPGDGSSNSILVDDDRSRWHGYIERGTWREV